jgi:riboflavin synthase
VTARDPADAIGRLTRWNSGADGNSPDGRKHACGRGRQRPAGPCLHTVRHRRDPRSPRKAVGSEENEVGAVFTGIVEELGEVVAVEEFSGTARLTVRGALATDGAATGDSVAVNGVCLTVTDFADGTFSADLTGETLSRSCLGAVRKGSPVNLERPVRLTDRLGGHIVQGHVDGTGTLAQRRPGGVVRVSVPASLSRYVIEKGSIAIDGISLTVSALGTGPDPGTHWIEVSLIPETLARTTMGSKQPGDPVNIEVDMIAKYVERLVAAGRSER